MAKMYGWIARYKGTETGAVVIETTAAKAKELFHERLPGGEIKDVRLTDQVKADWLNPDVILSVHDDRIKQLGYKGSEKV